MKEKIKEAINSASRDNGKVTSAEVMQINREGFSR